MGVIKHANWTMQLPSVSAWQISHGGSGDIVITHDSATIRLPAGCAWQISHGGAGNLNVTMLPLPSTHVANACSKTARPLKVPALGGSPRAGKTSTRPPTTPRHTLRHAPIP